MQHLRKGRDDDEKDKEKVSRLSQDLRATQDERSQMFVKELEMSYGPKMGGGKMGERKIESKEISMESSFLTSQYPHNITYLVTGHIVMVSLV